MNDSTSIYLIGRRQGLYPFTNSRWFLENSRHKELTGLRNVPQLKIVYSNDSFRVQITENAHKRYWDYFSRENHIKKYSDFINQIPNV